MLVKEARDVRPQPVHDEGAANVRMAVLIGPDEGAPNFVMRRIELDAQGHTPYHSHPWEHVVFVLEGLGVLRGEKGDLPLSPGDSAFVPPGEVHQFVAAEESPLTFLCTIPKR
ncbi:MAG: cupin domain-containing protein [Candidatus Zixiibacteriota bacterium]|nr:MAG: cupin domain-containing protein [candidate division Zixibacteria bacterium]